ncbi:family 20 glycosylhydrolase [Adhaeribacter rhizoryzae]|uniref:beta-N-acetylhexosaminidase n=1 Tax=Adhaeribacter rhizoryzae TaxID=2607907 RepID=A0A5M6DMR7_9BACT|nr:family 20 glycosylhydrolase [Adhaeribacter rhizoryzae]KAA5548837.1 family 20 glycosylhydrolase [Adhaeribacter rhizoryzae]
MRKILAGTFLLSHLLTIGCSQASREVKTSTQTITAATQAQNNPLKLTLELKDNRYQNKPQSRLELTIANTGEQALPAKGWKIFFNSSRLRTADSTVIQVKHYNGDLYYLAPGSKFKEIAPGKSAKIEIAGRSFRNYTDFPLGLYLVLDNNPKKGMPVAFEIKPGTHFQQSEQALAAKIFKENQIIQNIPAEKLTKVFPTPVTYQEKGQPFILNEETIIVADKDFQREAESLAQTLQGIMGTKPAIQNQGNGKAIRLRKAQNIPSEGYELKVNPNGIEIIASAPAGAFYGIQSLKTLLPASAFAGRVNAVTVSGLEVKDAPRFGYRGFQMDMARNFQPKAEVLKVLDVMALYKMNVFHFHFSEDEGWRLEIPSLPELTTVGATRLHDPESKTGLLPSYGSGPDNTTAAGTGFYSRTDFIEILKYARDRHIRVIPEIESPGHARAAIKAMDARYERLIKEGKKAEAERYLLRDLNDKSTYRSVQGWNDNVIDVSLPSTYNFLETVVDDIRAMYKEADAPLTTIHFGGDEVPGGVWAKSPAVKALMSKDKSIKTVDDLWYYYFGKVNQLVKARNLYLSGWEEIGLKKVVQNGKVNWIPNETFANQNFHVNVWKNSPGSGAEDLAYRMANAGYKVILTGVTHLYLDLAYNTSYYEPGQYWGGYVDLEKPFYFIPYDYLRNLREDDNGNPINRATIKSKEPLTAKGRANIVGMEAPLWSETNRSPQDFEYKMLPKLLSVAERAWSKDPAWATEKDATKGQNMYNQAWSEFVNVVAKRELPRLDVYSGGFNYRIPTPGAVIQDGKVTANVQFPGYTIRYTTDGSEPTATSPEYTQPVTAQGTIKLKAFNPAGRSSSTVTLENK